MKTTRAYNGIERPAFTPEYITELKPDEVFVFGSNLAGMHGGGAAYVAFKQFGAVMGCGVGLDGYERNPVEESLDKIICPGPISLSPMILLLFGMAETISGVAVRNRVIQAAGVVTGVGGIVLYYILGSLSESGVETTLLFTLAGIVLVLTGVILQVQNKQ